MVERTQGIIAHLVVDDAAAALEFLKQGLGATEEARMPAEDGKRIMHAAVTVNGAKLFIMDDFPEHRARSEDPQAPPGALKGTTVTLHLDVPDCDAAIARAVAAGAKVTMPPIDAFWGDRYGRIVDPFGHSWSFAHPLPQRAA